MDLTILDFDECWPFLLLHAFWSIRHTEISLADDDFDEIFADFVTACISGHISILQASKIGRSYFQLCKDFNPQL